MTKREIFFTTQFKKDLKAARKQNKDENKLWAVVESLANDEILDAKLRDHNLTGNYADYRECHIFPDWLLIYKKETDKLILMLYRLGSHSDLF